MKKTNLLFACLLPLLGASGQTKLKLAGDHIESISYNEAKRGAKRTLQYRPDGEDFVCVNGHNRYTRALYGGHTAFRLETSDRPLFAAYDKQNSKNISFRLELKGSSTPLDSVAHCEARYTPGRRSYLLTDHQWGKGTLRISALAYPDSDGAIWQIESDDMPAGATLLCQIAPIKARKLNRNGDLGADPADSFDADPLQNPLQVIRIQLNKGVKYVTLQELAISIPSQQIGKATYDKAEAARLLLASRIKIETPDPFFNTLGGALAVAADAIWDGEVWLHGAVGWRMPLSGWRAAYTGDVLGWHDRARKHFNVYAASQVTNVPNTIPHPAQDSVLNLARAEKRWGTPHYSNGYICRNPNRNDQMHHYDMNLCYIDELLWHLNWTGDIAYAKQMWPVLTKHLAWEKLNFDPDNDGLYDAYACIWASDALYYNSGAVTHSSAYNYRANKMAADIAAKIGEDPTPYRTQAGKILHALNARLWLPAQGHWAEYQDFMGHQRLHPSAGVWTIYHALDSEVANPFQAYQALRYVDTEIPHIPVQADGLVDQGYATIATTNWLPYSWSVNNVAFAEVMHTSLAYFQASCPEKGFKLLKSSILDGMYLGSSPGNFGQVSFYDAARGECYRDFGDPIGVASRVLVQGLFGILPDAMNGKLVIRPGFPQAWDKAALSIPDVDYSFLRQGSKDTYTITQRFESTLALSLQVNAHKESISSVTVNGKPTDWTFVEAASGCPVIDVSTGATGEVVIEITWGGAALQPFATTTLEAQEGAVLSCQALSGVKMEQIYDPQALFARSAIANQELTATLAPEVTGHHTFFAHVKQGEMQWWQPIDVTINKSPKAPLDAFKKVLPNVCQPVTMDGAFNSSVTDIFRNQYLAPRSPYTTLQLPKQGIGEWCHPTTMAEIDDAGMRSLVRDGLLSTALGITFRTPSQGNNIAFTSLWNNYPDSIQVPLAGKASHAYLLLAGSTNHMQCHIANGAVRIHYTDGSMDTIELINPDNWCPIEQDYFVDQLAFSLNTPRPYRLHFQSGLVSNNLEKDLKITGVYGRSIEGGAGVLLDVPLDASKELTHLTLETLSNDVIIGLMGITLQR